MKNALKTSKFGISSIVLFLLAICLIVATGIYLLANRDGSITVTEVEPNRFQLAPDEDSLEGFSATTLTKAGREALQKPLDTSGWQNFEQINISNHTRQGTGVGELSGSGQDGSVRFQCFASHYNYDDAIVSPGRPKTAHHHLYFGNTLTDSSSNFESLSQTGDSTCAGNQLNRSAYWIPALYDSAGYARIPQYALFYYKSGALHGKEINVLPDDLKIVAGNAKAKNTSENRTNYQWNCGFPGNYAEVKPHSEGKVIPDCPAGDALTLSLKFPQCWDGKNLDSINHMDHMAYPIYSGDSANCPKTHPVAIPEITYNIYWNNSDQRTKGWYLSSDKHAGLDVKGGTTTHGDWFGAWHPDILEAFVKECNNKDHDCKGASIGANMRMNPPVNTGVSSGKDIYNGKRTPEKFLPK